MKKLQLVLGKLVSWISPLVVLGTVGAIGWCGHTYHWNFAHALETYRESDESMDSVEPSAEPSKPVEIAVSDAPDSGGLPCIQFTSAEAAKSCGAVVAAVQSGAMDDRVIANAVIAYDQARLAQLSVRVTGSVSRVERRLGDYVKAGEPLAVIDSAEVGAAKTDLLEACLVYKLKTQHVERLAEIPRAIPQKQYIEAKADCELARARRFNALQKLNNLGFSLSFDQLNSSSADVLAEKLQRLGLTADSCGPTTASYNLVPVVAPFDGVITSCEIVQGESVEPLKTIYVVADTRRMWINLDVREDSAASLKIGAPVVFESDAIQKPVHGVLTWIGTGIDPHTRTIQARAETENPLLNGTSGSKKATRRLLQAGAFGTAHILVRQHPATAVVPKDAVHYQWEIGQDVVFVADEDGSTFQPQVVETGLVRDGYVEILDGLEPGDRIVTTGTRLLSTELAEYLQEHVGDNAMAVRNFRHGQELVQGSLSNKLQDESSKCSLPSFAGP